MKGKRNSWLLVGGPFDTGAQVSINLIQQFLVSCFPFLFTYVAPTKKNLLACSDCGE